MKGSMKVWFTIQAIIWAVIIYNSLIWLGTAFGLFTIVENLLRIMVWDTYFDFNVNFRQNSIMRMHVWREGEEEIEKKKGQVQGSWVYWVAWSIQQLQKWLNKKF